MKSWYYYKNYLKALFYSGRTGAKQWKIEMIKRDYVEREGKDLSYSTLLKNHLLLCGAFIGITLAIVISCSLYDRFFSDAGLLFAVECTALCAYLAGNQYITNHRDRRRQASGQTQ